MTDSITLPTHLIREQALYPGATGEFSRIMIHIALVGKMLARDLSHSGLIDILGSAGTTNVQGEEVQKLDQRANETFVQVFESNQIVGTLVSEEMEKPLVLPGHQNSSRYALFFDPLDGSSNIDVNAPLGSIFSIYRLPSQVTGDSGQELLKPGSEQIAGGYLLYGPSTLLVYTCGTGVHQFILDPEIGEFLSMGHHLRMPVKGKIYSVNEGNYNKWSPNVQRYMTYLHENDSETGRPYTSRYTGCLAADVHRILLKGGIYLYPDEPKRPEGKLRLMYEAAPLTFVMEQAGGLGSTGKERINSIQPTFLHQRVPLFIGSREDVEQAEHFIRG